MYVIVEFVKKVIQLRLCRQTGFMTKKRNATESYWPEKSENISKRNKAVEEMWTPH